LYFFHSQQFHLRGLRGASSQLDIKKFDQVLRSRDPGHPNLMYLYLQ